MADRTRAVLPQIRFMLSGSGHYTVGDGCNAKCPDAMVTGPTTSATRITAKGPLVVFGIGLLPAGWNAIIGGSAAEMTDIVEDARDVLGTFAEDMPDILRHSPSFDNMIGIADLSIRRLLHHPPDLPPTTFI